MDRGRSSWSQRVGGIVGVAVVVMSSGVVGARASDLDSACPAAARTGAYDDDDFAPQGSGPEDKTLSNRLVAPERIDPVRLPHRGALDRFTLLMETALAGTESEIRSAGNLKVTAHLMSADGEVFPEAVVANAAAVDRRSVLVPICIDPTPQGRPIPRGTYDTTVSFVDPRLPETSFRFEVWIGGPSETSYVVMATVAGVVLLTVLPGMVATVAVFNRRRWRVELAESVRWLGPLQVVAAGGYVAGVVQFHGADEFHLWTPTLDGAGELVSYALARVGTTLGAALAAVAVIPTWRKGIAQVLADPATEQAGEDAA